MHLVLPVWAVYGVQSLHSKLRCRHAHDHKWLAKRLGGSRAGSKKVSFQEGNRAQGHTQPPGHSQSHSPVNTSSVIYPYPCLPAGQLHCEMS
jgi:hypothetical protein